MDAAGDARRRRAPLVLMAASGFAGLGYEIVWTQQCALWLGHEAAAVLAVVAAFFGGLAVGAFALGRRVARSARPARWYAGCEAAVALWSACLLLAMRPFSAAALRLTGAEPAPVWQWSVAFAGTFLLLLPATAAMGATLPALERAVAGARRAKGEAQSIAGLYAANTFGAVAGVLAAAFWLVPRLGLARTAGIAIGINVLCGAAAAALFRTRAAAAADVAPPAAPAAAGARALLARLALTGLLGIGYEVLVVRVLGQVTEETVYTFALLLAVYLVGSAAGAAGYRRWLAARPDRARLTDPLLAALAAACLGGTASLWAAEHVRAAAQRALGGGVGAALAAEAALAVVAFGPPTIVMGALFSHLADRARASGVDFGRALGVNTLGAAAAPLLFGVLVAPALGPKLALLLVAAGYLALTARRAWSRPVVWAPAAAAVALALLAPPLAFIDVPPGGRVVSYREGVMAAVSVVADAGGVARLRIDNRQQEGSSATSRFDARQAWLPLLLHAAPRRALFLGLGTGVTAGAAARDTTLQVDAVELLPEVIEASSYFRSERDGPGPRVVAADARRYVRAADGSYDVIVSDNFHPARSGSGALYTVEHFQAVRRRLGAGGLFCQWLPLHQLDLDSLRSVVQSFLAAYPQGWAVLANNSLETPVVGLIGRADADRFDAAAIHDRVARAAARQPVAALGLEDDWAVLGAFVAGPAALRRFAGDAPANTDDRPIVAYRAPAITYAPDSSPRDRLFALLRQLAHHPLLPAALVAPPADPAWTARLAAYWQARDRFMASGRDVRPSPRVQEMLAQVREPLLAVLRISPDFRPAYDPLLAMATALAGSDAPGARALLAELSRLQPARGEATRALAMIDAGTPR
ncbi:MAG TPA: fused MFS/spermidine synthase [Polyangia bacterium]|jgi:spermidine synthase